MRRKSDRSGLTILLIAASALWPAAATGQSSIAVTNEWQMGEADGSGATSGAAVATVVDDIGGLNLTAVGSSVGSYPGYPTYTSPGAYAGSSLAVGFANPASTGSHGDPLATQYLAYSSSGTFNSSAGQNWGLDFWFNLPTLPATGVCDDLLMLGNEGANGGSNYSMSLEIAINNQSPNNGLYISNDSGSAGLFEDLSSFSPNTWYHLVYCDVNGTAGVWLDDSPLSAVTNWGSGFANGVTAALGSMPANIMVGAGWYGLETAGQPGFGLTGTIDELRFFSLTTAGVFNVADTDPTAASPHPGDANGDGRVDINDLTIVLAHFGQTGTVWSQGEFTGDGTVDINDLTIVLANFGYGVGADGRLNAVPEPAGLALLAGGALVLLAVGKRKRGR